MHVELTTFQFSDGSLVFLILSNVNGKCCGGKHGDDIGNDTLDDNDWLGNAGDIDGNRGVSIGEVTESGVSGVDNKSSDGITELEIVHGVSGKLYANSGNDSNDLLLNGDRGVFNDGSNDDDIDMGVRDGSDDGLNSDVK